MLIIYISINSQNDLSQLKNKLKEFGDLNIRDIYFKYDFEK